MPDMLNKLRCQPVGEGLNVMRKTTPRDIDVQWFFRPVVYPSGKPARGGQADLPAEALAQAGDTPSPVLARLWRAAKGSQ
jgi:hypothetical protein